MVTIRPEARRGRFARLAQVLGTLLILVGVTLLVVVAAIYSYGWMEEQRYAAQSEERRVAFEAERATADQGQIEEQAPSEQQVSPSQEPSDPEANLLSPLPPSGQTGSAQAPARRPSLAARRIVIPAIAVDSEVVEAEIKNGEWQVPKFVVGHLQGTANPGDKGNAVFSGHLQSLSSGNVFARLGELSPGDQIYILSSENQYLFEVRELKVVANTDLSVVQPTTDETVTLITCTGTWDFVRRDYRQRTIVVAKLYRDSPENSLAIQPR